MATPLQSHMPLSGIRVLDFSRVLAGPFCTMILGDLGADVVKIEDPRQGDETRTWGPPWINTSEERLSAYYVSINRNKRSMALNLKTDEGQAIARQLVQQADVLVENFRAGQMKRFDLDYPTLRKINPKLVYCSITGFGQDGPYRERPGYDYIIQAMSGLMAITGEATGPPQKVGVAVSDVFTGLFACNAIQAALRYAEQYGVGQHIDMALLDSQVAALVNIASNYLVSGHDAQRYGNQHANIVPYQKFESSNGQFVLAVGNDRQFERLCALIKQPDLSSDTRFSTNPARVTNRDLLIPLLQAAFKPHPTEHWIGLMLEAGIPAGPIHSISQALEDPHLHTRKMVQSAELEHDVLLRYVASPMHMSSTPPVWRLPPPQFGAHTEEILAELGYSNIETKNLRDKGAIR
ncbi:MAG: CaiB/BaiF CoA transferase family protein, partial [Chloroflexota bacterium]